MNDTEPKTKKCSACGLDLQLSKYYLNKLGNPALSRCIGCELARKKEARRSNPEKFRLACRISYEKRGHVRRLSNHGLTEESFNRMIKIQRGKCLVCRNYPDAKGLCIDHCHKTGAVRGLLCQRCNFALGLMLENPAAIFRLAQYAEGHELFAYTSDQK